MQYPTTENLKKKIFLCISKSIFEYLTIFFFILFFIFRILTTILLVCSKKNFNFTLKIGQKFYFKNTPKKRHILLKIDYLKNH